MLRCWRTPSGGLGGGGQWREHAWRNAIIAGWEGPSVICCDGNFIHVGEGITYVALADACLPGLRYALLFCSAGRTRADGCCLWLRARDVRYCSAASYRLLCCGILSFPPVCSLLSPEALFQCCKRSAATSSSHHCEILVPVVVALYAITVVLDMRALASLCPGRGWTTDIRTGIQAWLTPYECSYSAFAVRVGGWQTPRCLRNMEKG